MLHSLGLFFSFMLNDEGLSSLGHLLYVCVQLEQVLTLSSRQLTDLDLRTYFPWRFTESAVPQLLRIQHLSSLCLTVTTQSKAAVREKLEADRQWHELRII